MKPLKNRRLDPRCLSRDEAADYVGVSPSLFEQMVGDGRMPGANEELDTGPAKSGKD
jgi:hypothetical protein